MGVRAHVPELLSVQREVRAGCDGAGVRGGLAPRNVAVVLGNVNERSEEYAELHAELQEACGGRRGQWS